MYFDKEKFKDDIFVELPDEGDNILEALFELLFTGLIMIFGLFLCWKLGKKGSEKIIPFEETEKFYKKTGIRVG